MKLTPIFDPAHEALKEAGLIRTHSAADKNYLRELLDDNGLSLESVIAELSNVVRESPDQALKLRGIDTSLKLHRVMDDPDANKVPQVTIVIQASSNGGGGSIPSIFIPREISSEPIEA